jgi:hypothetical protein
MERWVRILLAAAAAVALAMPAAAKTKRKVFRVHHHVEFAVGEGEVSRSSQAPVGAQTIMGYPRGG